MKKILFVILNIMLILNACVPRPTATPTPPRATKTPLSIATQMPSPTPETWVRGAETDTGVELPTALFDSIKDQIPVLSADGNQVLNAETSEVLLEKKDGVWQTIEQGVAAEAMSEYGMPEEMAQQLENEVGVTFNEDVSPYVDGVLVSNEAGKHLFYFDAQQTEMWVAVDSFEGTIDIENITSTITEEELYSKELTAWLYYRASQVKFDLDKIRKDVTMGVGNAGGITYIGWNGRSNFEVAGSAPFERNPGALMNVDLPDNGPYTAHVFIPTVHLNVETEKADVVKQVLYGGEKVMSKILYMWRDEMNVSLIIKKYSESQQNPAHVTLVTEELLAERGVDIQDRLGAFQGGDTSALSDWDIVVASLSIPSKSHR